MINELEIETKVYRNGELIAKRSSLSWESAEEDFYKLQRFDEKQQKEKDK